MADFKVEILQVDAVKNVPDADRLDVAQIKGYQVVIGRDELTAGDLVAYLPTDALLPDDVISELGLDGMLSGSAKNRIKPRKLRGTLSQGLLYPVTGARLAGQRLSVGDVVTDLMGVEKYEPEIPFKMQGLQIPAAGCTLKYDIESLERYPDAFYNSETVEITEKLHGTWTCLGWHPDIGPVVTSKGLSHKEVAFKVDALQNAGNIYVRQWAAVQDVLLPWFEARGTPFYILGELFGGSVQDLSYDRRNPEFRVFDAYDGPPGQGTWVDSEGLDSLAERLGLQRVPVMYRGKMRRAPLTQLVSGQSSLARHLREGVVIKADPPRYSEVIGGRAIAKAVSEKYKLRKKGTEYN